MIEGLVSFETAKLAKEKGFNEPCTARWTILKTKTKYSVNYTNKSSSEKSNIIIRPTTSLLKKWVREVHGLFIQSKQLGLTDTEFIIVNMCGKKLTEPEIYYYYDGKLGGLDNELQKALALINHSHQST